MFNVEFNVIYESIAKDESATIFQVALSTTVGGRGPIIPFKVCQAVFPQLQWKKQLEVSQG